MSGSFKITPGGPEEAVARLEAVGRPMDGPFVLPGTNIRLGPRCRHRPGAGGR